MCQPDHLPSSGQEGEEMEWVKARAIQKSAPFDWEIMENKYVTEQKAKGSAMLEVWIFLF